MKQITILMGVFCALFAVSCHGTAGHDGHDAHADHQTGEQHEPEPAHADEIVLSADKARAAGVVVETVAAGDFRSVIPAGGVILPRPATRRQWWLRLRVLFPFGGRSWRAAPSVRARLFYHLLGQSAGR